MLMIAVQNPFRNHTPVIEPTEFYGRDTEILRVAQHIRDWQIFAISGEPRIGKTSLLYYLVDPKGARARDDFSAYIEEPANYLFVLVELQLLPRRRGLEFWRYVFDRLVEEAKRAEFETEEMHKKYVSIQDSASDYYEVQAGFESYLQILKRNVVLFFDDFDIVIQNFAPEEAIQVTDKLRTLKGSSVWSSRLNYIIASTDPLVRLFEANSLTNPSPLTNIITLIPPLGLLEQEAIDELIQNPLQQTHEHFTRDDITFLQQLAGRHPDFLKIACYYLLEARRKGYCDYIDVRQSIDHDANVRLRMNRLWERMEQAEELEHLPFREVLLQVAQGQNATNSHAFTELRLRGLIDSAISPPRIFADLFRTFIMQKKSSSPALPADTPDLTVLESRLYSYLVAHLEQTCSRQELQAAIWGKNIPSSPDALEQLVKRLRKKIEANPEQSLALFNIRGQGYLLRRTKQKR
jgi:hypothetical protein